jgi:carbamoyltransferase
MNILGVTSFIHTSSAALLCDGEIVAAADEERFTRVKHTGVFPERAIRFCLDQAGLSLAQLDHLAFYWHPFRAIGPRLLQVARNLPHSLAFFQPQAPGGPAVRGDFGAWLGMVGVAGRLARALGGPRRFRRHYVEHHLAHAASCYYPSPWDDALVLSLDGTGEWTTTLLARGRGARIEKLLEVAYPHSLGVLYGAATQYLGYRVYQDEWKIMGLAAYGRPQYADQVRRLVQPAGDGTFRLDLRYFSFQLADKKTWYGPRFQELFGPPRGPDEPIDSERCADLAASFQLVTEEIALGLVRHLLRIGGGSRRLCLAGGVALNSVLNGKILSETEVEDLFVQPAANDPGAGLGAALYVHHALLGGRRCGPMRHAYLGPEFGPERQRSALAAAGLRYRECAQIERETAALIAAGKVVGWYQGRMEYGPRALGNRSILADPRRAEMKDVVNAKVKFRERFRPFAPSILVERVGEYFEGGRPAPFMIVVLPVRPERRASIPAVTHADGSGRLQTVERETNPRYYRLIEEFERLTGVPVIMNTSFNVQGEPIVCTPEQAVACYLGSGLDALVVGDYLVVEKPGAIPTSSDPAADRN